MKALEVRNLKTYLHSPGGMVRAVDGVSFGIERAEVFGIGGESGSGKTMTGLSILRLLPRPAKIISGEVLFNGTDLLKADEDALRLVRGARISMVFQEPGS